MDQKFPALKRFLTYAKPYRRKIYGAGFYSVANKVFDVFPEILIGVAIDIVVKQEKSFLAGWGVSSPLTQLSILALLTFCIWALESLTEYKALVRWRDLSQRIQHALRMDGVQHCQKLSLKWYEDKNSGQLLSILGEDVHQIERFTNEGFHNIIQLMVSSLLIGAVFFYISPPVAVLAMLPIPLILFGGLKFRSRLEQRYQKVRAAAGQLSSRLAGLMSGVITIRSLVAENQMTTHVERDSKAYIEANQKAIALSTAFVPVIRIAVLMGFLFTLYWGGMKALNGEISAASYTVLVFLTQRLLWPFTRFGELLDLFERSMASIHRVFTLLEAPLEIEDCENPKPIPKGPRDVKFHQVSFQYRKDMPLLEDFSLEIKEGQFVALVGATGSGKSTITKLMLRFYEPTKGHISLGGTDIKDLKQKDLRKLIGYVSQDIFLLDGTIEENLTLGRDEATNEQVRRSAEMAEAHEFINKLPSSYQSLVGERGQKLSGGQRQRLAIARGLLSDPPFLILDEATSAVDNETEAAIQRSIERYRDSKKDPKNTLIVIAHRLSTIRRADTIFVLDQGRIVEQGDHVRLLAQKGVYARLWQIQTGEIS